VAYGRRACWDPVTSDSHRPKGLGIAEGYVAGVLAVDLAILRALRTHGHLPGIERGLIALTRTGELGIFWQVFCLIGTRVDPSRRELYLRTMLIVVLAGLTNMCLKNVVRRRRPTLDGLPALAWTFSSKSFPSAHSATSFAAARALSRGGLPRLPLYGVAKLMAISRVYTGVHYPSDIAAGAALGTLIAALQPVERRPVEF
jgi:membrane-associated phospholipid phosphatase